MEIFEQLESEVRSYSRAFPCVFNRAKNEFIYDENGCEYLDFLAGAGTLNYGHNNDIFKKSLLDYVDRDGITHGLDMHTDAKSSFLQSLEKHILKPRNMKHVVQFTGPTGTNAVEAALKIARKVTNKENIITFTNGFHGVSMGALATTGNAHHRGAAGISLSGGISRMPFANYMGDDMDTIAYFEKVLTDASSGIDFPAAVLVETVQGEGGINAASKEWLEKLDKLCKKHKILLIIDDIQAGCGRTGTFFSFDEMDVKPDIITLSKSLSGYGLPLAVVLLRPELDQWKPGEHNGTFRGNNLAFVTATAAIEHYWADDSFSKEVKRKAKYIRKRIENTVNQHPSLNLAPRGRGMFQAIDCVSGDFADKVTTKAFEKKLIIETSGAKDEVVKFLCPLVISDENLKKGLDIIDVAISEVAQEIQ